MSRNGVAAFFGATSAMGISLTDIIGIPAKVQVHCKRCNRMVWQSKSKATQGRPGMHKCLHGNLCKFNGPPCVKCNENK